MKKYLISLIIITFCLICISHDTIFVSYNEELSFKNKILSSSSAEVVKIEEDEEHPIKKEYEYGESIDLASNYIKVTYVNESTELIPLNTEGVSVVGFNGSSLGSKSVTITYLEHSITVTMTVKYTPEITISPSASGVVYNLERYFKAKVTTTDACLGTLTVVSDHPENAIVTEGESTLITNENMNTDITIRYKGLAYSIENIFRINFTPNDTSKCNIAEEMQFKLSVSRLSQTVTLTERTNMLYTGKPMEANPATTTGNGEITYDYYNGSSCSGTALEEAPTNIGAYSVKATAAQTPQYNSATSSCVHHRIGKSETTIVLDDINLTYSGTSVAANSAIAKLNSDDSEIEGATFTYTYYGSDDCSGDALSEIPINIGTYSVKAYMEGTSNYYESTSSCALYNINPFTPIINLEPRIEEYNGNELIANTATVTLTNNEIFNGNITYTYYNSTDCSGTARENPPINIGEYSVKASTEAFGNYSSSNKCVLHTITKMSATLTLTNQNLELIYKSSGSNTYSYNGDGEISCQSTNTAYVTCSVLAGENKIIVNSVRKTVNPVEIIVNATEGENYKAINNVSFMASVLAFTPIINIEPKTVVYNGSKIPAETATVTLTNDETFAGTISYTYYSTTNCSGSVLSEAPTNAGNYSVKASITANGNYNAASKCVLHTINKSSTTTKLLGMELPYTGSARHASGATSKLVSTNSVIKDGNYTYTYYNSDDCSGSKLNSAPVNIGYYGVIATLQGADNYNGSSSSCVSFRIYNAIPKFNLPELTIDSENKIFKNIKVGTKVKELFDTTDNNDHVEIYSIDDKLIYSKTIKDENVLLSTGMYIKFFEKIDTLATYKVSVIGDTSGDGKVNYLDYVNIYNHIKKVSHPESDKKLLTGEFFVSGDMNNDSKISYLDYVMVYNFIKKKN